MSKDVIVFDVETTGKDVGRDQIVEFSVQYGLTGKVKEKTWRVRPLIEISPGAEEVHGINMADLKDEPLFKQLGNKIRKILSEATIWVGYNLDFDINVIQAELKRNGFPQLDLQGKIILDPYKLWKQQEPRKLENAYQRFVGKTLENAHAADVDTRATAEVLVAMVEKFGLADVTPEELAIMCEPERSFWIGPSKHFQWNSSGTPIIAFGSKHADKPVMEVARSKDSSGYLKWILTNDFPSHAREIAGAAIDVAESDLKEEEFTKWVIETYGPPPSQ